MAGFKSDLIFLPDHGIGAVLLTNSDTGGMLLPPFMRRLLEVVFDGKPEAVGDVDGRAARYKALVAKDRERLVVPAGTQEVAKLATRTLAVRSASSRSTGKRRPLSSTSASGKAQ